ncbi:hypothetical protein CYMTET_44028 [Cymbomonas tetramitiformis]|uniref:Uncharacterized protein n=1 Tax=Cymbomonas tetramitiformis TaxID=36881 RepID=A0AAE0C2Y6_9CHLO|nr:hypothetical protein CYMTET_44028 [Cymbomonas tetramitiformis]
MNAQIHAALQQQQQQQAMMYSTLPQSIIGHLPQPFEDGEGCGRARDNDDDDDHDVQHQQQQLQHQHQQQQQLQHQQQLYHQYQQNLSRAAMQQGMHGGRAPSIPFQSNSAVMGGPMAHQAMSMASPAQGGQQAGAGQGATNAPPPGSQAPHAQQPGGAPPQGAQHQASMGSMGVPPAIAMWWPNGMTYQPGPPTSAQGCTGNEDMLLGAGAAGVGARVYPPGAHMPPANATPGVPASVLPEQQRQQTAPNMTGAIGGSPHMPTATNPASLQRFGLQFGQMGAAPGIPPMPATGARDHQVAHTADDLEKRAAA